MEILDKIPTKKPYTWNDTEYNWFDYKGSVYLIKRDPNGNEADFQIDGTMCRQASVTGYVYRSFKTKNKWFNPDWWYEKTCWSNDKSKIYFHDKKELKVSSSVKTIGDEKYWNNIYEKATELGRPIDNILKAIIEEVNLKTGLDIKLDFKKNEYGLHWYEAYVPVKIGKEKYLLTWENCD